MFNLLVEKSRKRIVPSYFEGTYVGTKKVRTLLVPVLYLYMYLVPSTYLSYIESTFVDKLRLKGFLRKISERFTTNKYAVRRQNWRTWSSAARIIGRDEFSSYETTLHLNNGTKREPGNDGSIYSIKFFVYIKQDFLESKPLLGRVTTQEMPVYYSFIYYY